LIDEPTSPRERITCGPLGLAVDVLHEGHDALAGAVALARRLLARGQDASVRPRSTMMLLRSKRRTMP
jgi:hypothetical protein